MSSPTASDLAATIDAAWEDRASLNAQTKGAVRDAVESALNALDSGKQRVAERDASGKWNVNQWLKKAVLLSFRLNPNRVMGQGPDVPLTGYAYDKAQPGPYWDKVPTKFEGWGAIQFGEAGFRAVPGAVVRRGAYVAKDAVLMPSFTNIGAYVGEGTMVDTWTTVGSCAQIGKHCHLSGGVGIGGVLEPLQANPVIIEDNCFIGARSEVAEGVIVREGSVLGMGVYLGQSTPIINRETGETIYGEVPPYSVIVSGGRPGKPIPGRNEGYTMYAAILVKQVDAGTRSKTSVNELLRM
ncbi:MAG TPA: 2,3,4,5-tetrahydropyridine-2,6-dicarboxylate N-succinyltransferase [Hyphomonadaceae bacterium]|jgi:2,3,4,5-tetrahydropyridine-2-carboxylate N-succinyltransferase|nr:2,3,4,5-tetrahydropyridine-2,6-dicarboxylate N-succinyltransferase [Hyphomonadaceae bacterium]